MKLKCDFSVDDRVELHPATDAWLSGDRYGRVTFVGSKFVHVSMDRSNRVLRMRPRNIFEKVWSDT